MGIGTSSPAATLDVQGGRIRQAGSAAITGYLETNSGLLASATALNPSLLVFGGDGSNAPYGLDLGYNGRYRLRLLTGGVAADFAFGYYSVGNPTQQSAFTEVVTITGAGNVGIGTATPSKPLEVATGSARLDAGIVFGPNSQGGAPGMHADGTNLYIEANAGNLYLRPQGEGNNASAAVLTSGGSLGILTLTPAYPLDVAGTIRMTGALLGGDMLMSGALKDSTGQYVHVDAGGCYYAD